MKRKLLQRTEPAPIITGNAEIILTAKVTGDILEVDVYEKKEILARHFLRKASKEVATLFMKKKTMLYGSNKPYEAGEWSGMKLSTLLTDGDLQMAYWRIEKKDAAIAPEHEEIIFSYLERKERYCTKSRAIKAIEYEESEYAYEKREIALLRKENRIEKMMGKVEMITETKEFKEWMMQIFPEKYIFTENRTFKLGKRYYCASCGGKFYSKEKWKHDSEHECKKCGTKAIVKTRTINICKKKSIIVFQQYDSDTVIERIFRFQCHSGLCNQKAIRSYWQQERIRLFLKEGKRTKIYYGTKNSEVASEHIQGWWDTKGGMLFDKKYLVYPGTIKDTTLPKVLKDELLVGATREMDYDKLVYAFEIRPFLEYLFKGKLFNLASEIIDCHCWSNGEIEFLDINATNIPDLLRLDKQRANRMRDIDGNSKALEALQYEIQKGEKISQENLRYIADNKIDLNDLCIDRTRLSVNKAINYLRRQTEENRMTAKVTLQYYRDYLNMAADRGMDLQDDIVRVNKRMLEFHNRYLEEKNRQANEKRAKELNKKFPNIKKNYRKNKELYGFETEEYVFILPKEASDIMTEGQIQHHCVGASDTYFKRMNEGTSFIAFMRRKSAPEIPYYTVEIKGTEIKQAYAAYDRQPDYGTVKKELSKWTQEIKKRMTKEQENGRIAS